MDRRSFFRVASSIGALFGLPAAALAQRPGPPGGPPGGMGRGGFGSQQRVDRLAQELHLTTDQKNKIKVIYDDQRTRMDRLRAETDAKVRKVLTPAQQKQYAAMEAQMRGRFG